MLRCGVHTWTLNAPLYEPSHTEQRAFAAALSTGDGAKLPSVPRWVFLEWLTRRGWLLHGSSRGDLSHFEPRAPKDLSPETFSKRTAVFAASDGVWAMMYALANRTRTKRMLNMALQARDGGGWSRTRYFLSLAPLDSSVTAGRNLLQPGSVYVLPRDGFVQMPAYHWPGLGDVLEPHWANPRPVRPIMRVPVAPDDFPLSVRTHDAAQIDTLSQSDPWGFPWLEPVSGRLRQGQLGVDVT